MKVFVENRDRRIYGERKNQLLVPPHFHSHFEIIYMLSGLSLINIDGCVYNLQDGDLVVVLPHQIHHIQDLLPGDSFLFIVPHTICEEYQELYNRALPLCPVIHRVWEQPQLHQMLIDAHETRERNEPFDQEILKGMLIIILAIAFRQMEFVPLKNNTMDVFRQIVKYCTENYDQPISLDSLSKRFYLSRYQISQLFSRNIQCNFHSFLASIRIMESCRLLEQGVSITNVATQSGFNSIRTFNRCFMEQTGMSPKQYKTIHLQKIH